jgi:CRISPR-associated protein Cst2
MNLFATVLTYPAPSANYRGESELNRTVIQKITDDRFDYPIISPEAMRNALRETLSNKYNLPCNRERLHDEDQLAVRFADYPNPDQYADDFLFGYLVAASGKDRERIRKEIADKRTKKAAEAFTFKRDSVLRMNLAKALEPYRFNAVFTQSPLSAKDSAYKNSAKSALLHRETSHTAFQYPFALNGNDCSAKPDWVKALLKAIGELSDVAGNHARSYYEMAPASIVVRLTPQLVAGYQTYGFRVERKPSDNQEQIHHLPEVIDGILHDPPDYPGNEFYIGGKIVKGMPTDQAEKLAKRGVTLDRDPRKLLDTVAVKFLGGK